MIYKLAVPGPIEDVEEVRVLEWHRAPGQTLAPDELVVELETYKAIVEVRGARSGVLRTILCEAGSWQKVGQPLAVLSDDADEPLPASPEGLADWLVSFEVN
jgi:pyruvate/2-oxoglutarate dehydrogenase complex dihydrolipoamide acyltransferase (E2) component